MTETTTAPADVLLPETGSAADKRRRGIVWQRVLTGALFATLTVAVALSFGFSWGNVGNQDTYLIGPLADADPGLFPRDWLVRETFPYHDSFSLFMQALMPFGDVAVIAAVANLLLTVAGLGLIALLARDLVKPVAPAAQALAVFGLFLIIMAGQTASVGVTYIFSSGLQPSVLAALCWLAAFLTFQRERWLLSGFWLAVGGFWHSNFLILGIPLFGLAHLLLGVRDSGLIGRWAAQLLPSGCILLFDLPALLAAGAGSGAAEAREIMQAVRSPNHYQPLTYLWGFQPWLFWHLAGLLAAYALRRQRQARLAGALLLACFIAVGSATILTTVVYLPQVSQAFVWRIAPFGILLAQAILLAWMAAAPAALPHERTLKIAVLAGAALIAVVLIASKEAVWSATLLIAAVIGAGLLLVRRKPAGLPTSGVPAAIGVLALAFAMPRGIERFEDIWTTSTLMPPWQASAQKSLYDWVATTPKEALFLIPPELATFRILGLRSVVVDWKSTPMLPDELIDWYRRIEAVSGIIAPRTREQIVAGYRQMTPERLASLHRSFGFDYAVFKAPLPKGLPREAVRYQNDRFIVLRPEAVR